MSWFLILLLGLVAILAGYRAWRRVRYFLHIFQLEGYKLGEYRQWIDSRAPRSIVEPRHWIGVAALAVYLLVGPVEFDASLIGLLVVWLVLFGSARNYRSDSDKKPLVFTARLQRLAGVALVVVLALATLLGGLLMDGLGADVAAWLLAVLLSVDGGSAWIVMVAGRLARPGEVRIQDGFKDDARRRLATQSSLTVIGITGSYGKTSVKFAIAEILSQRFSVLATPGSFNTPMGICKVINNDLRPSHEYLVLEMGARYPGDIAELCSIAQPDMAVLTSIGVAHLETMGSQEGIVETKSELVKNMRPGGRVIANADDERVMQIAQMARGPATTVSIKSSGADLFATDIEYDTEGCRFVVHDGSDFEEMRSVLLGAHNVTNILLGIAVGKICGLGLRQMKHAVARLRPVPHRLQLRTEGPITVIDDSFNSNPVGARNAIEILGQFGPGQRVIVTPGMVELGEAQDDENRALGRFMADYVDLAVLVGAKQTEPIRAGLRDAGFREDAVVVCKSLFDARDLLKSRLKPGDVVLYENDLPDQYDEG